MKTELEKLFIVIVRKKWNGDKTYILLSKSTQEYRASFSLSKDGLVYSTDFRGIHIIEMEKLINILKDF